jgi:adenylate cyclase
VGRGGPEAAVLGSVGCCTAKLKRSYPFPLLETPEELASHLGWTGEVNKDLFTYQSARMTREELDRKYRYRTAILSLDITGFTVSCIYGDEAEAFMRILDVQKVCLPVLREYDATLTRAFADDLVALFRDAGRALDAAFEIHRRGALFNELHAPRDLPRECCIGIGIGYGCVYAIGPNRAMVDEMNRSSKLGEDIARGSETLVTENAFSALEGRVDVLFESVTHDRMPFPYYRAFPADVSIT